MRSVRDGAVKGGLWLSGQRMGDRILGQIFSIILLRMLAPRDYGLLAMAVVVVGALDLFSHLAIDAAIIQRREIDDEFLSTAFWANFVGGVVLFAVAATASTFVAAFFKEPGISPILIALSLGFVIEAGSATQTALLARELRYRQLAYRTLFGTIIGGCTGIIMAYAGFGVWSLVGQILVAKIAAFVAIQVLTRWRPRAIFSRQRFRDLWKFSGPLVAAQLIGYAIRNTDNVLVGRYLGPIPLGFYAFGYTIFVVPIIDFGAPISHALFMTLSRLQQDAQRLRQAFLLGTRYTSMIALPAMVGLSMVASLLVEVIFGPKWLPSAPVMSILALAGFLRFTHLLGPSVLQAVGRTDFQMRWAVLAAFLYLPAFAIGLRWGIVGVASCYLLATIILTPFYYVSVARSIGVSIAEVWAALSSTVFSSGVMTAAVLPAKRFLTTTDLPKVLVMVLLVLLGGMVYFGFMAIIQRQWLVQLFHVVRGGLLTPVLESSQDGAES